MRYARIRDPAGTVRTGTYDDGVVTAAGEAFDAADDDVDLLAPCEPSKIVCVGRNYADHAEELGNEVPDRPLLFLKPPNSVADPHSTVTLPAGKERVDHEAEIAFVIGEQARNVAAEDAMDYVAGFTCLDDVSNRDDQNQEQNWVRGKAFDGSAPIGPCIADSEHVPADAGVELRVNGETKQSSSRDYFMFSIPELVEEITTYLTLESGDVVATGTPAGVGPLSDGDRVEIEVEGVGVLEHDVRQA
ncbi:fumarylacetoacetate hydrolase family protein [Halobaculum sp. CBA1158]|uniref:fumarylacetoacetate hydrolase family protein n=1 Tax=Halobaculum sp. CBA1158 TaxID=2904243 RepID=UPI001F2FC86A|nr:fumarylacetoacetate hydrolase family protein [Halobaculum sp. CBA1158]UIO99048.1 fumarylacetoacetate hydrolase family protein [Halobaculum sp. CBA1158]